MQLTADQKHLFRDHGYLHLPGLVPAPVWRRAVRAINAGIGNGMNVANMPTYHAQSFCPELSGTPPITDLLHATPAWPIAEAMIGPGRVRPVTGGQIALRFSRPLSEATVPPAKPHIDGMYTPTNGMKPGEIGSFAALVGVLLSDLPDENAGNFTVWPGSHAVHARYFKQHGPEALLNGMPPVDIGPPKQVTGRAGDVVIAHYLLAHGITANHSPHIRYACFFRLHATDHQATKWPAMTDPWLQWHGMRDA